MNQDGHKDLGIGGWDETKIAKKSKNANNKHTGLISVGAGTNKIKKCQDIALGVVNHIWTTEWYLQGLSSVDMARRNPHIQDAAASPSQFFWFVIRL